MPPHPDPDPTTALVTALLPPPPGRVVEVGCGPAGGFVPGLRAAGWDAVGIDPSAPEGPGYLRDRIEDVADQGPAAAVVARVSLHHVADLAAVLDRLAGWLTPTGSLVVIEWRWEDFDERAARWCFDRLPPDDEPHLHEGQGHHHGCHDHAGVGHDDHHGRAGGGWLARHRAEWRASGRPWEDHLRAWAEEAHLPTGADVLRALDARFTRERVEDVPYFADELPGTTWADEQAALAAGDLPASAFLYHGHPAR